MPLHGDQRSKIEVDGAVRLLGRSEDKIGSTAELLDLSRSNTPLQCPLAGPLGMPAIPLWYAGHRRPAQPMTLW